MIVIGERSVTAPYIGMTVPLNTLQTTLPEEVPICIQLRGIEATSYDTDDYRPFDLLH